MRRYNSQDGRLLRLVYKLHECIEGKKKSCAVCGGNRKVHNRPKTTSTCATCRLNLCRDPRGIRSSCWDIAHTQRSITPVRLESKTNSNYLHANDKQPAHVEPASRNVEPVSRTRTRKQLRIILSEDETASGNDEPTLGNVAPASGDFELAHGNVAPASGNVELAHGNVELEVGVISPDTSMFPPGNVEPAPGNVESTLGIPTPEFSVRSDVNRRVRNAEADGSNRARSRAEMMESDVAYHNARTPPKKRRHSSFT